MPDANHCPFPVSQSEMKYFLFMLDRVSDWLMMVKYLTLCDNLIICDYFTQLLTPPKFDTSLVLTFSCSEQFYTIKLYTSNLLTVKLYTIKLYTIMLHNQR